MSEAVRGLIVAHSSLANSMVAAVKQIAGIEEEVLQPITNEGQGPEALLESIRHTAGEAPVILFTDMSGGSCAFVARKLARERPQTGIVCGINLALLLDFVFHRELPLPELVDRLVATGRGAIVGACTQEESHADRAAAR